MMRSMIRHRAVARAMSGVLVVTGLVWLALFGCRNKQHGQLPTSVPIAIACPRNISSSLVIIAKEQGLFYQDGAVVTLIPFESGKVSLERMLAGEADLALVAETPLAKAILTGGKLSILASIHQSSRDVAIVARKDRGIHTPSDLEGKVIGFTQGTSGHFFLDTFCLVNRIGLGSTTFVDLPPLQLRNALLDGKVDAVSTWDPHVAFLMDALGPRSVLLRDEFIYTQTFCLVARPEFIRDHPDQVKAILTGLLSALKFMSGSSTQARDLVAAYTQVEPSLVSKAFTGHDFDVRLDQSLMLSIENECRWFLDSGAVQNHEIPDVLSYFYLPGLLEVRPEAVQVIRDEQGGLP